MYRLLFPFTLLMLLAFPHTARAQDYNPPLDLTYNAIGGDFHFDYPLGWSASPISSAPGVVLLTNIPAARTRLEGVAEGSLPQPGEVAILFFDSAYLNRRFGASAARGALSVATTMARAFGTNPFFPEFIDLSVLSINGRDGAQGIAYRDNVGGMIGVIDAGEGTFIGVIALSPLMEFPLWQPLFTRILFSVESGSITPTISAPIQTNGFMLDWVAQNAVRNMVGRAAAADGRLFVADGANGVVVLDEDGQILGRLANDDIVIASDIERAPDGTLWVADPGAKRLWNISTAGTTVQSAGDDDTFAASGSPEAVEVSPDGLIYSTERRFGDDGLQNWISVWSAEGGAVEQVDHFQLPLRSVVFSAFAADDAGLYVADGFSGVSLITPSGGIQQTGILAAELADRYVRGIKLLPDGTLVLGVDTLTEPDAAIWRITPNGEIVGRYTADQFGLNSFRNLAGFAVSEDEARLYMVDLNPTGSRVIALALDES